MATAYWLLKTEPSTYSFAQLQKDKKTNWNDIRNFQARNFLRKMKVGDKAFIYHSGDDKAVIGVAEIVKEAYPDVDPEGGDWSQVDIKFVAGLKKQITLSEIKSTKALADIPLIRQSRLSAMPLTKDMFDTLMKMGSL